MNKTTGIIAGIVIIAAIALGSYAALSNDAAMMDAKIGESSSMEEKTDAKVGESSGMEEKEVVMKDGGADMMEGAVTGGAMMSKGTYETYAPGKLTQVQTGDVILFFHASWCSSCRSLSADIEKNLSAIPSEVRILKVDYDTESELKKKYSVTNQHTLVQVDATGSMVKKWSGSPTLMSLVAEIK
jgi:thioredoxin 1